MQFIPKIIKIGKKEGYLITDLKKYDTAFFAGHYRGLRDFITAKNIDQNQYMVGYQKLNSWVLSDFSYPRAKIILSKDWVHDNVPKMIVLNNKIQKEKAKVKEKEINLEEPIELVDEINEKNDVVDDVVINDKIEHAPPILELTEDEKFKDAQGNSIEIDVRGERHPEKCYFRVIDIAKGFDLPRTHDTIIHATSSFEINLHYKYFTVIHGKNQNEKQQKPGIIDAMIFGKPNYKKYMYLTFNGLIKLLFTRRSKNAEVFQKWAYTSLFTIKLGTKEQKTRLIADIMGVPVEIVCEVLNKSASNTPASYLLFLNTVKELRKLMNIGPEHKDDSFVAKWGRANDLTKRIAEHKNDYGKWEGVDLRLKFYSYVDPLYIVEAEDHIRQFVKNNNLKFNYDNRDELIIIPKTFLKKVEEQYDFISCKYAGHIKDVLMEKKDLEHKLEIQQQKLEIQQQKLETQQQKHKCDLLEKELELEIVKSKEVLLKPTEIVANIKLENAEIESEYQLKIKQEETRQLELKIELEKINSKNHLQNNDVIKKIEDP